MNPEDIINAETINSGNTQVQNWFTKCGVVAVFTLIFSAAFCTFIYREYQTTERKIIELQAKYDAREINYDQQLDESTKYLRQLIELAATQKNKTQK